MKLYVHKTEYYNGNKSYLSSEFKMTTNLMLGFPLAVKVFRVYRIQQSMFTNNSNCRVPSGHNEHGSIQILVVL